MKKLLPALISVLLTGACGVPPELVRQAAEQNSDVLFYAQTSDSVIALTIDDGPHPTLTPRILDVLAEHEARATFFIMGRHVPGNEGLLRRMVAEGHELGNHMMGGTPSLFLSEDTFERRMHQAHRQLAPFDSVQWFRPASGMFDETMQRQVETYGYRLALGSIYPNDAQNPFVPYLAGFILRHAEPGSVIILHDGAWWRTRTVHVLRRVLPELRRRGYRVVTLSELAAPSRHAP
ncbi:MAG: polysaccharide deacetylase family protein [Rhodothermales bacterium]